MLETNISNYNLHRIINLFIFVIFILILKLEYIFDVRILKIKKWKIS